MSDDRVKMDGAIKKLVIPVLRKNNFKGTFPHFHRVRDGHIDLLTFQFDKWGGGFVVQISYADQKRNNVYINKNLPAKKLRSYQTKEWIRLGSIQNKGDHWFRYDNKKSFSGGSVFENIANDIATYLESQAEPWWRSKYID